MDNSERSIAEEQPVLGLHLPAYQIGLHPSTIYKIAKVSEIQAYERIADFENNKVQLNHPTLFNSSSQIAPFNTHFISEPMRTYFLHGPSIQNAESMLVRDEKYIAVKLPIMNIRRQNFLKVDVSSMKRNRPFCIQNRDVLTNRLVRFKYLFSYSENTLTLKVLLELEGQLKVWKEMEVPLPQNRVIIAIQEFNNTQTDIKLNDYTFHLILRMPYLAESNYHIVHNQQANIDRIELQCLSEGALLREEEMNCSKECQLI